jgi:hypothetical protein
LTNPKKYDIIIKMRKLSLGIIYCAIVSVVLILGACMKPVGFGDFLNDERVQDIVGGTEGVKGGIDYEHPSDLKPILTNGGQPQAENSRVDLSTGDSVTITVSNAVLVGYSGYEWYCNGVAFTAGVNGNEVIITADTTPFIAGEIYQLLVIGTVGDMSYSTWIFIRVEP